jgi:hypothetical protein
LVITSKKPRVSYQPIALRPYIKYMDHDDPIIQGIYQYRYEDFKVTRIMYLAEDTSSTYMELLIVELDDPLIALQLKLQLS